VNSLETEARLSLREAADALGISEVSARRWVKSGKLKAYQPGRKYLIPRAAVEELLTAGEAPKAEAPPEQGNPERRDVERAWKAAYESAWKAAYERHGSKILDQWEEELDRKLALAHDEPAAFFEWLEKLRDFGHSYVSDLVSAYAATARSPLEAVIVGAGPLVQRYMQIWHRIEETEADAGLRLTEEDERKFKRLLEEGTRLPSLVGDA
jgi:excisionase family DNA binding protein